MGKSSGKMDARRLKASAGAVVALAVLAAAIALLQAILPQPGGEGIQGIALEPRGPAGGPGVSVQVVNIGSPGDEAAAETAGDPSATSEPANPPKPKTPTVKVKVKRIDAKGRAEMRTVEVRKDDNLKRRTGELENLVVEGRKLPAGPARELAMKATNFTRNVDYVNQHAASLPAGCEVVSLSVTLNSMGYDVEPTDIADDYLAVFGTPPVGYSGSPYGNGGGLPPSIVNAANGWLNDHGNGERAYDMSDTAMDSLLKIVELGYPVLVWTTEGMATPYTSANTYGAPYWYSPEHCVVLYGVNGDDLLVSDSLAGLVRRDAKRFEQIYDGCGKFSAAILPDLGLDGKSKQSASSSTAGASSGSSPRSA